jgi:cell wall-associated NlpC family hydrolase
MSIQAAVGAIDQIYTLQQQLLNPASLMATGGSATASDGGAGLTGTSTSSTTPTDFATALANAQGLTGTDDTTAATGTTGSTDLSGLTGSTDLSGLTGSTSLAGLTGSSALSAAGVAGTAGVGSSGVPTQVQSMVDQANSLLGKPYVWGGGHSGWGPQTGYDCSGFVSSVLHAGGYLSAPQDTQTLPSQPGIEAGPGQYVTIYDRTDAGSNDHVIIDLNGQFYESGGEQGSWGGGGGVEKIGTPSASYLSTFNLVLHPEGL